MITGRWEEAREPNEKELNVTGVVAIEIKSASAKTQNGHLVDDNEDYELPVWAGIIPMKTHYLSLEKDSRLCEDIEVSESLQKLLSNS